MAARPGNDVQWDGADANPYAPVSADSPSELPRDEAILWTGQPDPRKFFSEIRASSIMAAVPLMIGLFLISLVLRDRFSLPGIVGGLVFLGAGAFVLSSVWRYYQRLKTVVYAITDQRAIVLRPVAWCKTASCVTPYRQAYSFDATAVRRRQLRSRGAGRIDIVMGREKHAGAKGLPRYHEVGFLGLTDVTEPERFLQQLIDSRADGQDETLGKRQSAEPLQLTNSGPSGLNGGLVGVLPSGDDAPVRLVGERVPGWHGTWLQRAPYVVAAILFAAVLIHEGVDLVRVWRAGLMQAQFLPIPFLFAIIVFGLLITWPLMERWWLPPCRRFELEGEWFRYWRDLNRPAVETSTSDIMRMRPIQSKSRIRGYLIKFRDGSRLYVNRHLTHADDLYLEISSRLS